MAEWAGSHTEVTARAGSLPTAVADPALDDVDVVAVPIVAATEFSATPLPIGSLGPGSVPGGSLAAARAAAELARSYGVELDDVIAGEKVTGKVGEVVRVPVLGRPGLPARFLLVGTGEAGPQELRRAAAALGRAARGRRHLMTTLGDDSNPESTRAVIEGLLLGGYTAPSSGLRSRTDQLPVGRVSLIGHHPAAALSHGLVHARATSLARVLAETPSNLKNPAWMAEQAERIAAESGLTAEVWDEHRLLAEGFGGLLAVGAGSATAPRFVRLDYHPVAEPGTRRTSTRRGNRPIVLVGKGITYDTGGISIKPRESMVPMKTDMSGAAAVLATLAGCRELGVRRPVIGLLPLAENAFGASSYRPGDVITVYGGTTVEILNTDAEGRMVLADALAYASARLDPELIVDVATLTGAATQGLGRRHAALYATDDQLAEAFGRAATESGEQIWRMPLVEDYRPVLDSPIADLRHVPGKGAAVGAGSITAALFLREFIGDHRWVHLDIAGTARSDREEYEVNRGATGYGARLLLRWLEAQR